MLKICCSCSRLCSASYLAFSCYYSRSCRVVSLCWSASILCTTGSSKGSEKDGFLFAVWGPDGARLVEWYRGGGAVLKSGLRVPLGGGGGRNSCFGAPPVAAHILAGTMASWLNDSASSHSCQTAAEWSLPAEKVCFSKRGFLYTSGATTCVEVVGSC